MLIKTEKNEYINLRITEEMKYKVEALAVKYGMSVSEFIRYLILNEIKKNDTQ